MQNFKASLSQEFELLEDKIFNKIQSETKPISKRIDDLEEKINDINRSKQEVTPPKIVVEAASPVRKQVKELEVDMTAPPQPTRT